MTNFTYGQLGLEEMLLSKYSLNTKYFFLCLKQTRKPTLGPINLLFNEYQGLFPKGQRGHDMKLTTHLH
jgi:hypothetical protein